MANCVASSPSGWASLPNLAVSGVSTAAMRTMSVRFVRPRPTCSCLRRSSCVMGAGTSLAPRWVTRYVSPSAIRSTRHRSSRFCRNAIPGMSSTVSNGTSDWSAGASASPHAT